MNAHEDDQLVAGYLRQLSSAASALPADRRAELIEEITVHIAEARAAGSGGSSDVRNILERLGGPADIVRAAADSPFGDFAAHGPVADGPWREGRAAAGAGGQAAAGGRAGPLEVAAVIFLLIGGVVLPVIGWVIGVVLLWVSPRWRTADKLLGTFVWPGGLLAPAGALLIGGGLAVGTGSSCGPVVGAAAAGPIGTASASTSGAVTSGTVHQVSQTAACTTSGGTPGWLIIVLAGAVMAVAIAGPILVAIRLLRRAARPPAEPAADASALLTV